MSEPPTFLAPLILLVPVGVIVVISRYSRWNLLVREDAQRAGVPGEY